MLDLISIRKELHKIPEIGFNEIKTQAFIMSILEKWKVLKLITFDFPGIVAVYNQNNNEDYILFRADMDALPIEENTKCDFSSINSGFMHACGHDIHMTVLIGLIEKVISNNLKKNILFVFQPAEEGRGGAERLLNTKVFENFNIKEAYALHVSNMFPVGTIASKSGIIFGIPQEFVLDIRGKGAHVAFPEKGVDAFLSGINFYQSVLTAITHKFSPRDSVMFHIGKVRSGNVMNQITDFCYMEGTFRVLSKENRDILRNIMLKTAKYIDEINGTKSEVKFTCTFDPVINDEELVKDLRKNLSNDVIYETCDIQMTGEDFGFFSTYYKSCLFWLGSGLGSGLHTSTFLPNEDCIFVGIKVLYSLLMK